MAYEYSMFRGEFFGTDFNFLYSEEIQKAFYDNCQDVNWTLYMQFDQYNQRGNIQAELGIYAQN